MIPMIPAVILVAAMAAAASLVLFKSQVVLQRVQAGVFLDALAKYPGPKGHPQALFGLPPDVPHPGGAPRGVGLAVGPHVDEAVQFGDVRVAWRQSRVSRCARAALLFVRPESPKELADIFKRLSVAV
jgi:hypothetical protein